jgi:Ca2+-binding RTX toxin-like protein
MTTGALVFNGSAETDGGRYVVNAGDGADNLTGGTGADTISGGVSTSDGADTITGLAGADSITAGAGIDRVYGDNGGTKRAETITVAIDQGGGTSAAGDTVTISLFGTAITHTYAANAVAAATAAGALATAINGSAALAGLVTAANTAGQATVVLTYLVDGNTAAALSTTGAGGRNTLSSGTVTAGTAGTTGADIIDGGAGADLIVGGGGADVLTGGAGADSFFFLQAHSTLTSLVTLSDYRAATGNNAGAADTIVLGNVTAVAGTVLTVQDFSAQASLGAALNAAANGNANNNGLVVFMWGGDTYVYVEETGGNAAAAATDFLVKITGTPYTTSTAIAGLGIDGI